MVSKKKTGQKKKSVGKTPKDSIEENGMKTCGHCWCEIWKFKLASMAFILFLITVWPAAMQLVHGIHWGWFLGAFVIFAALAFMKCGHKKC